MACTSQKSVTADRMTRDSDITSTSSLSLSENTIELPTQLPDGAYTDTVYSSTFVAEAGALKGKADPKTTYILIRE